MKILILSDSFPPNSLGGADKIAYWHALGLMQRGYDVLVITTTQNKNNEGDFKYNGVPVKRIYSSYAERWRSYVSLYNPLAIKNVKKIIEDFKPDIVHAHNIHFYLSYACLKIAKKSGAKVFLTAHDVMSVAYRKLPLSKEKLLNNNFKISFIDRLKQARKRFNPFREIIIKYYLKYVDVIFTVSDYLQEILKQNSIKNKMITLHNGIDLNKWESVSSGMIASFKDEFSLKDKKVIFFGGRLSYEKGAEKVLLALKNIPNSVLLVLGKQNDYSDNLKNVIKDNNLEDRVIFTGWIEGDKLLASYGASDVVCVPSLYPDPFPTVNLEAMASKKPVLGTCFGGTREIVIHNKTGYIVDPFNIDKISFYLNDLLTNKDKSYNFGKLGYQRVQNEFSNKQWINRLISYY